MPKAPFVEVKGPCGFPLSTKIWKRERGHSIKCERRGSSCMRYWKPDKTRYGLVSMSDIDAEVWEFCSRCRLKDNKYDPNEKRRWS